MVNSPPTPVQTDRIGSSNHIQDPGDGGNRPGAWPTLLRSADMSKRTCDVPECDKPHLARGYCRTHLARYYRNGSPDLQPARKRGICSLPNCERPHKGHGYCSGHLQRARRGADLSKPLMQKWDGCTVPDCMQESHGLGLCTVHYYEANKTLYRERYRRWARENPERVQARQARRRARRKVGMTANDRTLSVEYRKAISTDPCRYCGKPGDHVDHFYPLAKGGTDHWWNLVRACESCNLSKAARCGTWFLLRGGGGEPVVIAAVA